MVIEFGTFGRLGLGILFLLGILTLQPVDMVGIIIASVMEGWFGA